jgi:hypothetical protein
MATTVIIPARNEEATIGEIVRKFTSHPETIGRVYVGLDAHTTDETAREVWANGGCAIHTDQHGKGEVVTATLGMVRQYGDLSGRIILCDADYMGLTHDHIQRMTQPETGVTIGVPDWPDTDIPIRVINSWPLVSGFRALPWALIPEDAHGYLLETQINLAAIKAKLAIRPVFMPGLKSPFQWPLSPRRMAALATDLAWGQEHGIL